MKFHGTTATFLKRSDGALIGYIVEGHSDYAESGSDIVCAAISATTQMVLYGLKDVLKAPVMFDQDDDGAFIEAQLTPEASQEQIDKAQLLLVPLYDELKAIEEKYPRNLRIKIIFRERR